MVVSDITISVSLPIGVEAPCGGPGSMYGGVAPSLRPSDQARQVGCAGAASVGSQRSHWQFVTLIPVSERMKPQWLTTRVFDQSGKAAISARNSAARPTTESAVSSIGGHQISSTLEKSCAGQACSSSVFGVPTSQAKASRSRTIGLMNTSSPSAFAIGRRFGAHAYRAR